MDNSEIETKQTVQQTGSSDKKPRETVATRAFDIGHWLVNYVGIGWVLNAFLSIKMYDFLKPKAEEKGAHALAKASIGLIESFKKIGPAGKAKALAMSRTFIMVGLMGFGGFAVTPFQKLYGMIQNKITHHLTPAAKDGAVEKTPELRHERLSHWVIGKAVGFTAACTAVMLFEHAFPKFIPIVTQKITAALRKVFSSVNEDTVKNYFVEQYAALLSITSLALVKPALDKKFPPELTEGHSGGHFKKQGLQVDNLASPAASDKKQVNPSSRSQQRIQNKILETGPSENHRSRVQESVSHPLTAGL